MTNEEDKINVSFIGQDSSITTQTVPLANLECVEHLVQEVIRDQHICSVFQPMFGLRLVAENIYLPPNYKLKELLTILGDEPDKKLLEVRLRFQPSASPKVIRLSESAFNLLFAQVRHDFVNTKFYGDKLDLVALNHSVQGLIVFDLLRHSLENSIQLDDVFNQVNPVDFIPRKACPVQRTLLNQFWEKLSRSKTIQIASDTFHSDLRRIKAAFMDLFFHDVCRDYGAEVFRVVRTDISVAPQKQLVRVRCRHESPKPNFIIETRKSSFHGKSSSHWTQVCDLGSVRGAAITGANVIIKRSNGRPFQAKFESPKHAQSFVSAVDGYHRTFKRWYSTICKDVASPQLIKLMAMKAHGPLGYVVTRAKIPSTKKCGTYLIRMCLDSSTKFMIDVILTSNSRLVLDVHWDQKRKLFKIGDYDINKPTRRFTLETPKSEYSDFKTLTDEIRIRVHDKDGHSFIGCPPIQLLHLVHPSEYDDYIMLASSKSEELEAKMADKQLAAISDLPRVIPLQMLRFSKSPIRPGNRLQVSYATISIEQTVVVKEHLEDDVLDLEFQYKDLIITTRQVKDGRFKFQDKLKPAQLAMVDWISIKGPWFVETIGIDLTCHALVQEYFPLGRLDKYLKESPETPESFRRTIIGQLANALIYLQERRLIHGKVRCHNVMLKNLEPVQVKLSDPLGTFDAVRDQAFLPPEYFGLRGELHVKDYDNGLDIWALGTTLWQLYSRGDYPPHGTFANTLLRPKECPVQVWSLIEDCWAVDPSARASPHTIYRDLKDSFDGRRGLHSYDYISESMSPSVDAYAATDSCRSQTNGLSTPVYSNGSQTSLIRLSVSGVTNKHHSGYSDSKPMNHVSGTYGASKRLPWKGLMHNIKSLGKRIGIEDYNYNFFNLSDDFSEFSISSDYKTTRDNIDPNSDYQELKSLPYNQVVSLVDSKQILTLGSVIGRGSSGVVIKSVMRQADSDHPDDPDSGQVVAVKKIENGDTNDLHKMEDLRREFEILSRLDHENVVKTLGFIEAEMMLVIEFMPLGSMLSCIRNRRNGDISNLPLKMYSRDIARGMEYLESMKIVHRDLALRNILLLDYNHVKICDFGLAQFLSPSGHYQLKTDRALPLKWYAPEVLKTWLFSHKSDVWSYGIVLWEMYSGGSCPQYSVDYEDLLETLKHERLLMPMECPLYMYNLMLDCWAYEPDDRLTFTQICDQLDETSRPN